jgi:rhodanese-related sulfurtransferase
MRLISPSPSGRFKPGWPMLPDHEAAAQAPPSVTREEVRRLVEAGAQLVEVLPQDEFDDEHLPGAVSLPLKSLTAGTAAELDRSRPVIVYCWDGL